MSSHDHIVAARNDDFAGRVLMLTLKTAQFVASEDPGTAEHAARVSYAERIFRGGDQAKQIAAHVISSNATIQATIDSDPTKYGSNVSDGDIEFALSSIWTARSLAFVGVAV